MQVTLDTAKSYLRVDSSDDDALISGLIVSAETLVREVTRLNDEELLPYKEIVEIAVKKKLNKILPDCQIHIVETGGIASVYAGIGGIILAYA